MRTRPIICCVIDGLGDEPIPSLDGATPLEGAATPHFDALAAEGILGTFDAFHRSGHNPTSQEGHLSLFGYPPTEYGPGRGLLEVLGLGVDVAEGDVCLRGNFATLGEDGTIKDRRAGRIKETGSLVEAVDGMEIRGITVRVYQGLDHRIGVVLRGKGLSDAVSDGDHKETGIEPPSIQPTADTEEAALTAEVLNLFLQRSREVLQAHDLNVQRRRAGELPANYILTRGAGMKWQVPSFGDRYQRRAACIAGAPLYKGIGRYLGMDAITVEGANGLPSTNVRGKFETAINTVDSYDFVFVHVKAADNLAEDGKWRGKKEFLEKMDKAAEVFRPLPDNMLLVVTGDHSTCSLKERHCKQPVPLLIAGDGTDNNEAFGESECAEGGIGHMEQGEVMEYILSLHAKHQDG